MLLKPTKFYKVFSNSSKDSPSRHRILVIQKDSLLSGFTLIELLVVIVIITILASVLLITFKGVDERAKLSNLIQFSQSQRTNFFNELVGWWPFDELVAEGASTTTIDNSFQRNRSVVQGGVKVAKGIINSALEFNGVDSYVDVPPSSSLTLTGELTIEAWIRFDGDTGVIQEPFFISGASIYRATNGSTLFYLRQSGGGGAWKSCSFGNINIDRTWHYFAGRYFTNRTFESFLDGKRINSCNLGADRDISMVGGELGASWGTPIRFFKGLIDEVQIYNAALPIAVIQQHYAQGLERHQNLAWR